jgi:hypothetical protein
MVETGAGFQGGIPLGSAKMNYDVWVSNGPQLLMDDSTNVGQFEFESFTDNNKNKAIGGRIGLLPFSNSSLEIGFSYENAAQTGLQYTAEQKVAVNMMAIDANYFQSIAALKSTLRIAGEYKSQSVTQHSYQLESGTYDFKNESNAFYAMVSLRPTASNNNTLRNLEFAARYSSFNQPKDAPWGGGKDHVTTRTTFAIDYWLKWNCVFKVAYQLQDRMTNQLLLQLYYGF